VKFVGGSLTGFIKAQPTFWSATCPDIRKVITSVNRALRERPLRVPLRSENRLIAGPLGTAIDYYVGWSAGETLHQQVVRVSNLSPDARAISKHIAATLIGLRSNTSLSRKDEAQLGRACLVLAQLESAYRTGNTLFIPSATELRTNDRAPFDRWLVRQINAPLIEEWTALAEQVKALSIPLRGAVYNPVFGGYGLITGSDGDLLVNETLYDIKCSVDGFDGDAVRQLLGYCALSILNNRSLAIQRVGLISIRRGFVWQADVESLCWTVGATSLARLTDALRQFVKPRRGRTSER
jgi:hypothetical protein